MLCGTFLKDLRYSKSKGSSINGRRTANSLGLGSNMRFLKFVDVQNLTLNWAPEAFGPSSFTSFSASCICGSARRCPLAYGLEGLEGLETWHIMGISWAYHGILATCQSLLDVSSAQLLMAKVLHLQQVGTSLSEVEDSDLMVLMSPVSLGRSW